MFCRTLVSRLNFVLSPQNVRSFCCTGSVLAMKDNRRTWVVTTPKRDEGAVGEKAAEIDIAGFSKICEFPDMDTDDRLFDNIPFKHLPVIHIKASKNNTLYFLNDHEGHTMYARSCGMDGFKNCRKSTNIAAQVTATAFGKVITKMGHVTCRVRINGLGPGRMAAFKGLQMSGVNIISITDSTPCYQYPKQRPPAARSV